MADKSQAKNTESHSKEQLSAEFRHRLLEGLAAGEKDLQAGRVLTHEQAKKKMARWLK